MVITDYLSFKPLEGYRDPAEYKEAIQLSVEAVIEEQILEISEFPTIFLTCNQKILPWNTVGTFDITTSKLYVNGIIPLRMMCEGLSHELVHYEQSSTGRLQWDKTEEMIIWEGKRYPLFDPDVDDYRDYEQSPWEIDAFSREKTVLRHIMQVLNG